jgi:hypothetical protein
MAGHLLGVLKRSVVLQVNRDAGCSPGVRSDGSEKTRRFGPLPNRSPSGARSYEKPRNSKPCSGLEREVVLRGSG